MAKMTKAQARRRTVEIRQKAFRMVEAGHMTIKDFSAIEKICKMTAKKLGY